MLAPIDRSAFNKLKRSLLRIREDVRGLLISRFIFKEVQKIIAANPSIQIESSFYEWIGYVYATHAVIGVRRQVDKDTRSVSLVQVLEVIEKNNAFFTVKRFQRLYPKSLKRNVAPRVFKRFSGARLAHLNPVFVSKDIRTLRKSIERIAHFTNKRVAHLDRSAFRAVPTFDDLDYALDQLEKVVKNYMLLLFGEDSDLVPIWQYDWQKIFHYPWIQKDEGSPSIAASSIGSNGDVSLKLNN
ncbi:MAG: hypothetical protein WAO19_10610 [Candidatus Kryptoniota bacterium]